MDIKTIMADVFDCAADEITEDAAINETSGWDSLNHIRLILSLQGAGIDIPANMIPDLTSYQSIHEFVQNA